MEENKDINATLIANTSLVSSLKEQFDLKKVNMGHIFLFIMVSV